MGSLGVCCREACIEPPEIQITGLTSSSAWTLPNPTFCCWQKTFFYNSWPISPTKYTSPTISDLAIEFKGRRTIEATVGTVSGPDCIDQEDIDLGYIERWRIYEDAYRKYAYISPLSNQVVVKAHLVTIIESGLPVVYWAFSIQEEFTSTYGFDRKFRNYVDNILVAIECATWRNGLANVNDPTYLSRPTSTWVEQTPIASGAVDGSITFGLVRLSTLEALPPGDWNEQVVSTTDANTPAVSGCLTGVQDPFLLAYSISPSPACSQIEVSTAACGEQIITTGNVLFDPNFLTAQLIGRYDFADPVFVDHLRLNAGCCIDTGTVCNFNPSTSTFNWSARAEVITSTCTSTYSPVDMIVHPSYTVRFRLP
jgi:hypothetical protein